MKSKLAQRLALQYYKTKFNTLGRIAPALAARQAFELFCTPRNSRPAFDAPHLFTTAEALTLQHHNVTVRGWRWHAPQGSSKTVLIAHGFDSYTYKFEKFISPLLNKGYNVMAFDAPAHGTSDGTKINALIYKQLIAAIDEQFGPLYGVIAHSLGGLATSLAAENLPHLQQIVLIAPATETESALQGYFRMLQIIPAVQKELRQLIYNISNQPISYYSAARATQNISTPIFWIHDVHDSICPFSDVQPVVDRHQPNITFHITKGLGHSPYKDPDILQEILARF